MESLDEINRLLAEKEQQLAQLDVRRAELLAHITTLQQEKAPFLRLQEPLLPSVGVPSMTNQSSPEAKIALFRSLFRGREDVYPRRFESLKTGKQGYAPVCRNEWVSGICEKPKIRCEDCAHRALVLPQRKDVVGERLSSHKPGKTRGFCLRKRHLIPPSVEAFDIDGRSGSDML